MGLVGSIDNDMPGTDMTIGALSALHRITEALDAIHSTAASHQRTFVVEVMGRHCGWLGADGSDSRAGRTSCSSPESPPEVEDWRETDVPAAGGGTEGGPAGQRRRPVGGATRPRRAAHRSGGRTEGRSRSELGVDVRVTILGHVQRGGKPCAFDRDMGSLVGYAAAVESLTARPAAEPS